MFLNFNKNGFVFIIVPVTLLLFVTVNFIWPETAYRTKFIIGDGRGHYVYLPNVCINKSFDFKDIYEEEIKDRPGFIGHNFHKIHNVYVNKFPVGTAVMISPFFCIAHQIAKHTKFKADGFSLPYQYAVAVAALFWLLTGLYFLKKTLILYNIDDNVITFTLLFLVLATNLFHQGFVDTSMSHVYSFAAISMFIYYSKKFFTGNKTEYLISTGFLLGLIFLIRQVNILILFAIPFIAGDKTTLIKKIKLLFTSGKNFLKFFVPFILAVSPQLIINIIQTGNIYVYGYKGEGFNFFHPETVKFLFSFQKGWFIYTPAMLLLFPALISLYKISKYQFYTFVIFISVLIYVFSSWWNWFFGDSFGMRPMVDYYSVFAVVIAIMIDRLNKKKKIFIYGFVAILAFLNIFQSYQYFKKIIHVDSMDFKAYKYVFLKSSDEYINSIGSDPEYYNGKLSPPLFLSENAFNNKKWKNPPLKKLNRDSSGKLYFALNKKNIFSPSLAIQADTNLSGKKLYIKLSAVYQENDTNAAKKAFFTVNVKNNKGKDIFYKAFSLKKVPDNVLNKKILFKSGMKLPVLSNGNIIKVYIWNKGGKRLNLYKTSVSIHEIEN